MISRLLKTTAIAITLAAVAGSAVSAETLLLKNPTVSDKKIAFSYAGDIWTADRTGGNTQRLTSRQAQEGRPVFSPDGKTIAFSAVYDGNLDVYTVPTEGGQPTRLTFHPGGDTAVGWTPDGKSVLFTSRREMRVGRSAQAWHISAEGGLPTKVMDAVVMDAAWDSKGERLAYQPYNVAHRGSSGWRNHRGGSVPPIWIIDPVKGELEEVPHVRASDTNPMWAGGDVYFISDRSGTKNIWHYDSGKKSVEQITKETTWDIASAKSDGRTIIYATTEGRIKELDTRRGRTKEISITIRPDLPEQRPQWKNSMRNLTNIGLSPTGKRALVTARGDVFTVPLKDGTTRNLNKTSGVKESNATWSPQGGEIAYLSDKERKGQLVVADQKGKVKRTYELGGADYTIASWEGDGSKIIYGDNHLNVFSLDMESGDSTKIYTDNRRNGVNISMAPGGKWMAYTKARSNLFSDVYLYSFETKEHTLITDGMSHAASPAFSPDGKYLYFAASTNAGSTAVGLDMSTQEKPRRFGLYALVLAADGKSPLLPKAGDEKDTSEKSDEKDGDEKDAKDKNGDDNGNGNGDKTDAKKDKKDDKKKKPKTTKVDLEGLSDRMVALPVAERSYGSLNVASDGALFFMEFTQPGISNEPSRTPFTATLKRFDFKSKKAKTAMERIQGYTFSEDRKTILVVTPGGNLKSGKAGKSVETKPVKTGDVRAFITPQEEWAQIFDEVWRLQKQYFYDAGMHGLDWDAMYRKYQPLVAHAGTRAELNTILVDLISEQQVGHNRTGGGDQFRDPRSNTGLLGANLRIENGKYRIGEIFTGEKWNPFLKAPLAAPGIGAKTGDYIHAVNGTALAANDNIYAHFAGTVGKQVTLSVSSDGNAENAKDIVVEPVANEGQLRHWEWVESNRKKVDELSDGKVGYVYLPNTAGGGYTYFNRMYFAQTDKAGMVIDERQNGGGQAANYITDVLSRQYLSSWKDRDGMIFDTPGSAVYGPKVMLIDQDAGSGGDFLPYAFKRMKLGKLIGKTTWGGLIGISANPGLIDGGFLTVPYFRFFTPEGEWRIENEGTAPDIEVGLDPLAVNAGRDTQLERGVQEVLSQLETYKPIKLREAPAMPTEVGK
ncbi:MAG: peptidase S41 [Kordiimonadales bacterium]|nr:MAG: peptidase S41 [Kordiimonadales bacterium]